MYLNLDKKHANALAIIDDSGNQFTYGDLIVTIDSWRSFFLENRKLVFLLCDNTAVFAATYVALIELKVVPLMLSADIDNGLLANLIDEYKPYCIIGTKPVERNDRLEVQTLCGTIVTIFNGASPSLHPDLALLFPTSGTTGSPKLVRHSYKNLNFSAQKVAEVFQVSDQSRPIAQLPIHYTMGLSVLTSHLYGGATVLLCKSALTDGKFWSFIKENEATSFTGVPYSFEVLTKLRLFRMQLPHLTLLSQGGGKLNEALWTTIVEESQKKRMQFLPTYGQTEGTARMAYCPPDFATQKTGTIGIPIPGGKFYLLDEQGSTISNTWTEGELVYEGDNVAMGYAYSKDDLSLDDIWKGKLHTGDLAKFDEDHFFYITGRKSRFLKLYGLRIGLDDVEQILKDTYDFDCAATGDDTLLKVLITDQKVVTLVHDFLVEKTGLFHKAIEVVYCEVIPRNAAGKVIYNVNRD